MADSSENWRREFAVLVPQVDAIGMIAVVRSLGRAGYRVHACSADSAALGLRSRFAFASHVHPAYDDESFLAWLRDCLQKQKIKAIVPSEGFLLAIRGAFAEFADVLPGLPDEPTVYDCLSKARVTEILRSGGAGAFLPPSRVIDSRGEPVGPEELAHFPRPFFIKTDAVLAKRRGDSQVLQADDPTRALTLARSLLRDYDKVLIQGAVEGRKACVNFCTMAGELLAESICLAIHENPHRGGLTAYRHTWWHQAMRDDALAKCRALGWQGVAMVEYKWDAETKTFCFIEINARYWAALHLDLFAGTDFPRIQLDSFFGRASPPAPRQALHIRARHTLPAHSGHVLSRIKDPEVGWGAKLLTVLHFFLLFLDPRVKADLFFPGDRGLYWIQLRKFLAEIGKR